MKPRVHPRPSSSTHVDDPNVRPRLQRMRSKRFRPHVTTQPQMRPPALTCPSCERPLTYQFSRIGGVSERFPEQWDFLACGTCGSVEYRPRTRKMRRLGADEERWINALKMSNASQLLWG